MREYAKKPESQSHILDSNTKASKQAPIDVILQRYKERNIQRFAEDEELIQGKFETAQREEIDEDELLQGKFSDTVQLLEEEGSKLLERGKEDKLRQKLAEELKIKDKGHSRHKGSYDPKGDSPEKILTNLTDPCFDQSAKYAEGEAVIQREEIDEEELLQGKFATFTTQREEIPSEGGEANLTGMPDNLKSGIESLSGYSMDDVRVHYNSSKPAQLQALAYAQGTDIHVAPGQEQHLPHEAWHIVQQKQGRVQPTMQLQGIKLNDNKGLEREAEIMGKKADISSEKSIYLRNIKYPLPFIIQRVLKVDKRGIGEKTLFSKTAFKKRLTKQIDKKGKELETGRDEIRNEIIKLIRSKESYYFENTHDLIDYALIESSKTKQQETPDNWLIFGMDGKDLKTIKQALQIGYRKFDCAESYNNTVLLSQAIKEMNIDRKRLEITYKFNLDTSDNDLYTKLMAIAKLFENSIDNVLIHNLDVAENYIKSAWGILGKLKSEKIISKIGLSNINENHIDLINDLNKVNEVNIIENSLSSILTNKKLLDYMKDSEFDVLYYDVIRTANEIGINSDKGVEALISYIDTNVNQEKTHMICSSSSLKRNINNYIKYEGGKIRTEFEWDKINSENMTQIYNWIKSQQIINENEEINLDIKVIEQIKKIINEIDSYRIQVGAMDIQNWFDKNTNLSKIIQDTVLIPARIGLKKRYYKMKLGDVLIALFGTKNCDWKWSIELLQLLITSVDVWESIKIGFKEIIDQS